MHVIGLDNREYVLSTKTKKQNNISKNHLLVKELLKEMFPLDNIIEELLLPGTKIAGGKVLYADFFIPRIKLIVEINGQQHYSYNTFFHKNKLDFLRHKKRDLVKKRWCEINNFKYSELNDKDDVDEWRRTILCSIES